MIILLVIWGFLLLITLLLFFFSRNTPVREYRDVSAQFEEIKAKGKKKKKDFKNKK